MPSSRTPSPPRRGGGRWTRFVSSSFLLPLLHLRLLSPLLYSFIYPWVGCRWKRCLWLVDLPLRFVSFHSHPPLHALTTLSTFSPLMEVFNYRCDSPKWVLRHLQLTFSSPRLYDLKTILTSFRHYSLNNILMITST